MPIDYSEWGDPDDPLNEKKRENHLQFAIARRASFISWEEYSRKSVKFPRGSFGPKKGTCSEKERYEERHRHRRWVKREGRYVDYQTFLALSGKDAAKTIVDRFLEKMERIKKGVVG